MTSALDTVDIKAHATGMDLTTQQESYVLYRVRGLNPAASARQIGLRPKDGLELESLPHVAHAIAYFLGIARQEAVTNAVFTKDDATAMYMEAHAKSATATEEIKAIDSLVKLHGLAVPEKKELVVTHKGQLAQYSDEELAELAGKSDIKLDPSQYNVKDD